jgi:hypothetical protein
LVEAKANPAETHLLADRNMEQPILRKRPHIQSHNEMYMISITALCMLLYLRVGTAALGMRKFGEVPSPGKFEFGAQQLDAPCHHVCPSQSKPDDNRDATRSFSIQI